MMMIGLLVMVVVVMVMMVLIVLMVMMVLMVMVLRMMGPENPLSLSHWFLFGGFAQLDLVYSQVLDTEY